MPRPAIAHVVYGCATVVLSTLAILLLSGARSGGAVVGAASAGLVLGLAVAAALTAGGRRSAAPAPRIPAPRPRAGRCAPTTEARVGEHSLR